MLAAAAAAPAFGGATPPPPTGQSRGRQDGLDPRVGHGLQALVHDLGGGGYVERGVTAFGPLGTRSALALYPVALRPAIDEMNSKVPLPCCSDGMKTRAVFNATTKFSCQI